MTEKATRPPRLAEWILYHSLNREDRDFVIGDFEEIHQEILADSGKSKARSWYWRQALKSLPHFIHHFFYWKIAMLRNHFKVAYRNLVRNWGYSMINISGLAIGITYAIFILLFVLFELSYDSYHPNADRTYIVGLSRESKSGRELASSNMPLMGQALRADFAQIEHVARITSMGNVSVVKYGDKHFKEEELWYVEPDIFKILAIPFVKGSPESALNSVGTTVISENMAVKYFGYKNPLGEIINIDEKDYEVTGVFEDFPLNTGFSSHIIMSWKSVEDHEYLQGWHPGMLSTLTLLELKEGVDPRIFESLISKIPHHYAGEALTERGLEYRNILHPIRDIHLYPLSGESLTASTSLVYVYIFSVTAVLVLVIACMNFMNLSTARFSNRSGEIGIRKVVGALRKQIIAQFMGESVFISFIAMISAVILVLLLMPLFNEIASMRFLPSDLVDGRILTGLLAILVIVAVTAGSYPAFFLSAFKPVAVLKGTLDVGSRATNLRKVMVVVQFAISITIIISSIVIYQQIVFMKNQPLGFEKEQKLVVQLKTWEMITDNYEDVKNEFLNHSSIINACASSGVPGSQINRTWVYPSEEEAEKGQAFRSLRCDQDFIQTYGIKVIAGRSFQKDIEGDVHEAFMINEAAVKAFGWSSPEEAVGKYLWDQRYPIIGVTENFHWWGLQQSIEPMIMRVVPSLLNSITLTVNTANMDETLSFVKTKYGELFPGDLFEYYFVDQNFQKQYQFEEKIFGIFQVFTFLGMFISCLGLIGLASFVSERRTREIGIRKVMGASNQIIVFLLSKEFIIWVLVSNVIAWPLAWVAGSKWLQNFAFRIDLDFMPFILASVIAVVLAALTVSFQAFRASTKSPAETLNCN